VGTTSRLVAEGASRSWFLAWLTLAACGSDAQAPAGSTELSICATGQTSACRCGDGRSPGATGCEALVSAGMGARAGTTGGARAMTLPMSGSGGALVVSGRSGATATAGSAAGQSGSVPGTAGARPTAAGTGAAVGGGAGVAGLSAIAGSAAGSGAGAVADCGDGGMMGKASNAGGVKGSGYGNTQMTIAAGNQILHFRTTMEVPIKPNGNTTLFLWPGLEPLQGTNYNPIGTGVLQPVLTWGGSCAPGSPQTSTGKNWWISAQYVNTLTSDADHKGCHGGPVMDVEIGNQLLIEMSLSGTIWKQTVTNMANGKAVDFDMDMDKQPQRWALFEIEAPTSTKPAADVVFTNTVLTFENPEPKACQPTARGTNDYFSTPISSSDGLRCCIARIVLRAQGVAATTMDP
jgi:hypothetical protein